MYTMLKAQQVIILAVLIAKAANANFIFKIQFHSYMNPNHESYVNMGCCDDGNRVPPNCRNRCDTYLHICLRNSTSTMDVLRQGECPFGSTLTDLLGDGTDGDNIILKAEENLDISGNLSNPLSFPSNKSWPGSIQVIIQSFDRDSGTDDYIDAAIITTHSLDLESTEFTAKRHYIGVFGLSNYELSFQATCDEDYYGRDCSVFCTPRNDSMGYYFCDQNGNIECAPGYTDPSTNCTECSTSHGCSSSGGFCTRPYECLCYEGYSGENCTIISMETDGLDTTVGAIAGGAVAGLLLLIVSLGVVIAFVFLIARKQNASAANKSKAQVFQENATYMDLIDRDNLTRSTELMISGEQHYELEPVPTIHMTNLGAAFESSYSRHSDSQEPHYAAVNQTAVVTTSSLNHSDNNIDLSMSDAGSSTSLQKVRCYSSTNILPSYEKQGSGDELAPSLQGGEDKAESTTEPTHGDNIPMRRNNSYSVLEIEEQNTAKVETEGNELVYSYSRIPSTDKSTEKVGYTTVSTKIDENSSYSQIELSNMYENIEPEDSMMENELYGSTALTEEHHVPGLFDPYTNEDLGPN